MLMVLRYNKTIIIVNNDLKPQPAKHNNSTGLGRVGLTTRTPPRTSTAKQSSKGSRKKHNHQIISTQPKMMTVRITKKNQQMNEQTIQSILSCALRILWFFTNQTTTASSGWFSSPSVASKCFMSAAIRKVLFSDKYFTTSCF